MRLTEMEYQPRAQNESIINTMMTHWNRKSNKTVRSRDAVLTDLYKIWESQRSDTSTLREFKSLDTTLQDKRSDTSTLREFKSSDTALQDKLKNRPRPSHV
jgi:hypothetical protein